MKRTIFALIACILFSTTAIVASPAPDILESDQIVLVEEISTAISVDATAQTNEVNAIYFLDVLEGVESVPIVSQAHSYTTSFTCESFIANLNTPTFTCNTYLERCQKLKPLSNSNATKTLVNGFVIRDLVVPLAIKS